MYIISPYNRIQIRTDREYIRNLFNYPPISYLYDVTYDVNLKDCKSPRVFIIGLANLEGVICANACDQRGSGTNKLDQAKLIGRQCNKRLITTRCRSTTTLTLQCHYGWLMIAQRCKSQRFSRLFCRICTHTYIYENSSIMKIILRNG